MSFKSDIRLQRNVLLIGLILMLIKGYTFFATNSNAILSDALESLVNIFGGSFALFSLNVAAKPSDKNHPYGHGKVEFISGFVEGALVVVAGLYMVGKSVYDIVVPHAVEQLLLGIFLTAITGLVNFLMGFRLKAEGQKKKSMIMISEGIHLMSDGYTSLALIIGIFVVWISGLPVLDNVVSILFGLYILYTGYGIFKRSISGIMDEMDMDLVAEIVKDINEERRPEWVDVHNLRVIKFGRDIHIDCHLTLPWYFNLEQAHAQVSLFEKLIKKKISPDTELFIHTDPCIEKSCSVCAVENCKHRKHKFNRLITWEADNILENTKHSEV